MSWLIDKLFRTARVSCGIHYCTEYGTTWIYDRDGKLWVCDKHKHILERK